MESRHVHQWKELEPDMGGADLRWLLVLMGVLILVGTVAAIETPLWLAPYGPGYEYKNGSLVDDFATNSSIIGAYINSTAAKWVAGAVQITADNHNFYYKNETFGVGNYSMTCQASSTSDWMNCDVLFAATDISGVNGIQDGYLFQTMAAGSYSDVLYKVVGGGFTSLGSGAWAGGTGTYNYFCNWTPADTVTRIRCGVNGGTTLTSADNTYTTPGFFGAQAGRASAFTATVDNLSFESPPGMGNAGATGGVNWTNLTGYPTTVTGGTSIHLNDTTTIDHITLPQHKTGNLADWHGWEIFNSTHNISSFTSTFGNRNISITTNSMVGPYLVKETVNNTYGPNSTTKTTYITITVAGPGGGTFYVADFTCSPMHGVRAGPRVCTNQTAGGVTWFGNGSLPCLSSNTTAHATIWPRNWSYCNICLTVTDSDGANANTTCKLGTAGPWTMMPWTGF